MCSDVVTSAFNCIFCSTYFQFLSRLLLKFKNTSSEVNTSTGGEPNAFAKQVAEKISICVQSSDEFLKSECPVCLEEPRVEDAVYSK